MAKPHIPGSPKFIIVEDGMVVVCWKSLDLVV